MYAVVVEQLLNGFLPTGFVLPGAAIFVHSVEHS
ncbi:hypothetical protein EDC40_104403 [Aminobacter aminovorans]|uniref:Uncharacterized protein n=1 Tax=Aminobacter aminovorans TaxID=83263 RepID=A0A380WG87_AMIAI|nr:hypothetical protein EDC40_104403 [Aminobacter aminovorans]SUU88007.1 Uncharacterised protein [Aminobacter aminovorans]